MLRSSSTRALRRAGASALVLGLVSSFFVAVASPALAADPPMGLFEIDGNLSLQEAADPPDDPGLIDWATAGTDSRITQFKTLGDDGASYIDSAKEHDPSTWECAANEAPPKDDILRLYLASQITASKQFLHVGYVRDKGEGDTDINIEFHRSSAQFSCPEGDANGIGRADGDFMISFDFGGGGGAAQLDAYVWESSQGVGIADDFVPSDGHWVLQTPRPAILGANNSGIETDPLAQNASLTARTFGEVTVDLSQYFRSGLLSCPGAGYVTPHSRASHSFASDVKDVLPESTFDLSDCGSLKLKKVDGSGAPMKDVTFGLYLKKDDGTKGAPVQQNGQNLTCKTDAAGICHFPKVPTGTFLLDEIDLSDDYSPDPGLPYPVTINAFSLTDLTDTEGEWFVNTRKTGSLTVVKDLEPPTDPGKFDLRIDGVVKKAGAGDGGSTGKVTVNTGSHTFDEVAANGTDLANYVDTKSCKVDGIEISTGNSVNVGHNQDVVCTITNVRKTGTLTVVKDLDPPTDPGRFDLRIDGVVEKAGAGDGDSTGKVTVNTGSHTFDEVAANGTDLANYVDTKSCKVGGIEISTGNSVNVGHNQDVVCTITNTRRTGTLTVKKVLVPADDLGLFNLQIDSATAGTGGDVGNGGTTGAIKLNTGVHSFGETAGTNTDLDDYASSSVCLAGDAPVNITEGSSVVIGEQNVVCTITNTRKTGTLKVVKDLSPDNDPGKFNLLIDGVERASGVGDGGATPAVTVNTGSHSFVEAAGTNTNLADYTSASACVADVGSVQVDGSSVTVAHNQNVVCTITNTRKTGTLTVIKDLTRPGDTGKFNLLIDGEVRASNIGDGGTTGAVTLNTGSHSFGETAGTDTHLADYEAGSSCFAGNEEVSVDGEGFVVIGEGVDVVCTITNARITGSLTVSKTTSGGTGTFVFDVVCSDGSERVITIVNSGAETILDIPTGTTCTVTERNNPLFSPTVIPADGKAVIDRDGETVAFTNTAKPNGITLDKKVNAGDHTSIEDALRAHAGDPLTYTVVISNTGQVPLTITALSDSLYPELVAACPQAVGSVLAAGAAFTCTYTVAAGDDAHNVAGVSAVDDLGRPLTVSDGTYVNVVHPAISIVKTASPESISVSGSVTYTYVVTNTGDVTLFDVLISDDILGPIGSIGRLEPGESVTMAKTVDVDVLTPPRNIGTAVGTDVLGQAVSATDDAVITVVLGAVLAQLELPRTGAPLRAQAWAALAMIQVGLFLTLAGRRRRVIRRAD